MRILLRVIGLLCLINILMICLILLLGRLFPSTLLNWNGSQVTFYDARTGVEFAFPNPQFATTSPSVSGIEVLTSEDGDYTLSIRSDSTGLSINLRNRADEVLFRLERDRVSRINNIGWLDNRNFIIVRVSTGQLNFSIFNVDTLQERPLGAYSNTAYSFSPNREWLLLIDNDSNETLLRHFFDARQHIPNPIADIASWSNDGRYLASRARLDESLGFQLLDTESGAIETNDFIPNRLSWSSNNSSLIIYDRQQLLLYKHSRLTIENSFAETLLNVTWSYDGEYALIITQSNSEKVLYLLDEQTENISLWAIVPDTINERSLVWAYDSNTLSYILPNAEPNQQSAVYILGVESNQPEFLTYIPNSIPRAFALDNIGIFENLLFN